MKNLIKKIYSKLFDYGGPINIESSYSVEESIKILSGITRRNSFMISMFSMVSSPQLVGEVSEKKVVLQRVAPFFANAQKPVFFGRFVKLDERALLEGVFTTSLLPKVVLFINLIILTVVELIIIFSVFGHNNFDRLLLKIAQVFFIPALVFISYWVAIAIKRWSSKDVVWISEKITSVLQDCK